MILEVIFIIATIEFVEILDKSEELGQLILQSSTMEEYNAAKNEMENDSVAQTLIARFNKMKEKYEEVERFGRYHPDYSTIMKEVRVTKREMDMHETIAAFKIKETELQGFLDEISKIVAYAVSDKIMVPMDGALFTEGGCGCGSGGGCGCQAS